MRPDGLDAVHARHAASPAARGRRGVLARLAARAPACHRAPPSRRDRPRSPIDVSHVDEHLARAASLSSTTSTRAVRAGSAAAARDRLRCEPTPSRAVNQKRAALARRAVDADLAAHQLRPGAGRSPGPGRCRRSGGVVEVSACAKRLEQAAAAAPASMPMPVSRTSKRSSTVGVVALDARRTRDDDLAALGELDGVVAAG